MPRSKTFGIILAIAVSCTIVFFASPASAGKPVSPAPCSDTSYVLCLTGSGPASATAGQKLTYTVNVTNTGSATLRVLVVFRLGDEQSRELRLAGGKTASVKFTVTAPSVPGSYTLDAFAAAQGYAGYVEMHFPLTVN